MNPASPVEMVACVKCGHEIHDSAPMCPQCGALQRSRRYKIKGVATVLAFFFGWIGVHRFYLGQWWGIFYLLFSWTAIPLVISLVEFLVFLFTSQERWDLKHNEGKPAGPTEGSGIALVIVVIIVGFFALQFVLGVFTAIAIPAYNDYIMRSQVSLAISESAMVRIRAAEYMLTLQAMPTNNADLGLTDPHVTNSMHHITVTDGEVRLRIMETNSQLDGKSIWLLPVTTGNAYEVIWVCSSEQLAPRLLPAECRN